MTCSVTKKIKNNDNIFPSLRHVDDVSLLSVFVYICTQQTHTHSKIHKMMNLTDDFLIKAAMLQITEEFVQKNKQKNSSIKAEYLAVEDLNYRDLQCFFEALLFWKIPELFFSFTQITALEGNEKHEGF